MYLKARSRRVAIPVVDSVSQTYHFAPLQYSFRIKPPLKLQIVSVIIRSAMLRALHQGSLLEIGSITRVTPYISIQTRVSLFSV